jgi:MarR family transcriptional regulator, organic hydroperoxide resistance regulator
MAHGTDISEEPARALTCEHWPRTTPLAERTGPTVHAVFRLSRMHKTIIGGLLRELGLAPGQELLLLQLWDRDRCSQADLVERLGLDPSTVTKMLQRLERDGWVGREPSPSDHRVMVVTLTPAGRGLQDAVTALWSELEGQTVKSLSPAERAEFLRLLRKVEGGLRASRGAAASGEPLG